MHPCSFLRSSLAAACALVLALTGTEAIGAVIKSAIPGAHARANDAAQVELNRARSRLRLNNLDGALAAARAAVAKDSLASEVYDLLGGVLMRHRRHEEAYVA